MPTIFVGGVGSIPCSIYSLYPPSVIRSNAPLVEKPVVDLCLCSPRVNKWNDPVNRLKRVCLWLFFCNSKHHFWLCHRPWNTSMGHLTGRVKYWLNQWGCRIPWKNLNIPTVTVWHPCTKSPLVELSSHFLTKAGHVVEHPMCVLHTPSRRVNLTL